MNPVPEWKTNKNGEKHCFASHTWAEYSTFSDEKLCFHKSHSLLVFAQVYDLKIWVFYELCLVLQHLFVGNVKY